MINLFRLFHARKAVKSSRSFLNDGRFIDNGLFTKEMFPKG